MKMGKLQNTISALAVTGLLAGCGGSAEDVTNADILKAINSQPTPVCEVAPVPPSTAPTEIPTPVNTKTVVPAAINTPTSEVITREGSKPIVSGVKVFPNIEEMYVESAVTFDNIVWVGLYRVHKDSEDPLGMTLEFMSAAWLPPHFDGDFFLPVSDPNDLGNKPEIGDELLFLVFDAPEGYEPGLTTDEPLVIGTVEVQDFVPEQQE